MTKAQLINALIDQKDLATTLSRLLECYKETKTNETYGKRLIRDTEAILKELEDGDQPVYFDCPKSEVNFLAEVNTIVPGHKVPHDTDAHADSIILTA